MGGDAPLKRGEQIAQELEARIVSCGWKVGQRLGTEDDLAREFGASRSIIREAIAIAELDGFVESHRGQYGGLFVSAAAQVTRVATLRHYLALAGATPEDVNAMRFTVEAQVCELAMARIRADEVGRLRDLVVLPPGEAPEDLAQHTNALLYEILRIAGHPGLSLFALTLAQGNIDIALWNGADEYDVLELTRTVWGFRTRQVEAIIGGDLANVLAMQRAISTAGLALHERFRSPPETVELALLRLSLLGLKYPLVGRVKVAKKPEAVARLIAQQIATQRLTLGARIGSESELVEKYGVSRGVLREAVRWLERHGVAKVLRGKEGGLHVVRPDPTAVVRASSLYLASGSDRRAADFHAVAQIQQLAAVDRAAARARCGDPALGELIQDARARLEAGLGADDEPDVTGLYSLLAEASGSPVIDCLMGAMIFPLRFLRRSAGSPEERDTFRRGQLRMIKAIEAGDAPLARRHVLELQALTAAFDPELLTAGDMVGQRVVTRREPRPLA